LAFGPGLSSTTIRLAVVTVLVRLNVLAPDRVFGAINDGRV